MTSFDRDLWLGASSDAEVNNPRAALAQAVLADVALAGRSRDEIVQDLGEPEVERTNELWYFMGWAPLSIKYLYLIVTLDRERKVESAFLTRK